MKWRRLRESRNVERRRGGAGRKVAMGGGIGAIVIALIAMVLGGGKLDLGKILGLLNQQGGQGQQQSQMPPSEEDQVVDEFVRRILGSTEDVWTKVFRKNNLNYEPPRLIQYDGMTPMKRGGMADARMGPFYVPSERQVYLDTMFFKQMDKEYGGGGDFAYAYVISHEVAHHVQNLLGYSKKVINPRTGQKDNGMSVRLELQADYLAGVWAYHANERHRRETGSNLLDKEDLLEAMRAASAIGDDSLQRKATGRVRPESFSHGTSEQRQKWLLAGLRSGEVSTEILQHFFNPRIGHLQL